MEAVAIGSINGNISLFRCNTNIKTGLVIVRYYRESVAAFAGIHEDVLMMIAECANEVNGAPTQEAVDAALGGKGWSLGSTYSTQSVPEANAIIYFPPGEYILYDKETDSIDGKSYSIEIRAGHFIIAGAGKRQADLTG